MFSAYTIYLKVLEKIIAAITSYLLTVRFKWVSGCFSWPGELRDQLAHQLKPTKRLV